MNVKFCCLLFLLLPQPTRQETPEGIVIAKIYQNPYLNVLSALRTYCRSMFERMSTCVRYRLRNDSEADGDLITQDCTGLQFEIVDKTYKQTIENSFPVFLKIFSQRLFSLRFEFADEISHFISRFKFMLRKNLIMFTSMQTSLKRANYYVEKSKYASLLEILEPEMLLFSKFQGRLKSDKSELINLIEKLLDQRDQDLKDLKARRKDEANDYEFEDDEHSKKSSEEIPEENLPEDLEHQIAELDSEIGALHSKNDEHELNEALDHSIKAKPKEPKEKFIVYQETTFLEEGDKKVGPADHGGHADHHGGHAVYPVSAGVGSPEKLIGYFLDDAEDPPYTFMEKLKIPEDGQLPEDFW